MLIWIILNVVTSSNLWLIFSQEFWDTTFFRTLKCSSLFITSLKNTLQENIKSPFDFQHDPITIQIIDNKEPCLNA